VFLADKIYFGGQKHTLPLSDDNQNPPTSVVGFEANHLAEKHTSKWKKYSRCKVKPIENKTDVFGLCQPLPKTTTRKKVTAFCLLEKVKRENYIRRGSSEREASLSEQKINSVFHRWAIFRLFSAGFRWKYSRFLQKKISSK